LAVFLPLTLLTVILMYFRPDSDIVKYVKFTSTLLLFTAAIAVKKQSKEQKIMAVGFVFSLIGDFFLALLPALPINLDGTMLGIGSFMIAYIFLISAFQKNLRIGWAEIVIAIPFFGILICFFATMYMNIKGLMMIAAILFSITIFYLAWNAVSSIFWKYFKLKVALQIALFAILIFSSDLAVAYEIFHPAFQKNVVWLAIFVRVTYTMGWTILLSVLCEDKIHLHKTHALKCSRLAPTSQYPGARGHLR
jgi:hypothetical protein